MPNANIYEKFPYIKKTHEHWNGLLNSNGNHLDVYNLSEGTSIYYSVGTPNNRQDIKKDLGNDKYFIINNKDSYYNASEGGGRKRKQSKYSSKKRSVKSRRSRNSRKRRYSRRR